MHPISNLTGILLLQTGRFMWSINKKLKKGRWPLSSQKKRKPNKLRTLNPSLLSHYNKPSSSYPQLIHLAKVQTPKSHKKAIKTMISRVSHLDRDFWGSKNRWRRQKEIKNHPKKKNKKPKNKTQFGKVPKLLRNSSKI